MDATRLGKNPSIAAVMTAFPYSVGVDEPITRAQALMAEHDIRHIPVKDDNRLVGVVTERDIAVRMSSVASIEDQQRLTVREVYVPRAYVVDLAAPLSEVAAGMARRHIGSALVVKKGRLAGIFTVTDACRVLGTLLGASPTEPDRDGDDEVA